MKTKTLLPKSPSGCPYLLLAPMEGVGDRSFRRALHTIGGFDEAVTEFISIPSNASAPGLIKSYDPNELNPTPLAAQIMGVNGALMAEVAALLEAKGAPRVDINCGCPSNTVTGRGAGSSLLKDPTRLYELVKEVKSSLHIPLTVKMRSGYEDTSLIKENLLAIESAGASFVTLHPRTKIEGYSPPANWDLITLAKETVSIPVIGNGDITSPEKALAMLEKTKCDALMIGRGVIMNPFLFQEIRARFENRPTLSWDQLHTYLQTFLSSLHSDMPLKRKTGKLKQILGFILQSNPTLQGHRKEILRLNPETPEILLKEALPLLEANFFQRS